MENFDKYLIERIKNQDIFEIINELNGNNICKVYGYDILLNTISYINNFNNQTIYAGVKKYYEILNGIKININRSDINKNVINESIKNLSNIIFDKLYIILNKSELTKDKLNEIVSKFNMRANVCDNKITYNLNEHPLIKSYSFACSLYLALSTKYYSVDSDLDELLDFYDNNKILVNNLLNIIAIDKGYYCFSNFPRRYNYLLNRNEKITNEYNLNSCGSSVINEIYLIDKLIKNKDTKDFKNEFNNIIKDISDYKRYKKSDLIEKFKEYNYGDETLNFIIKFMENNKTEFKYDSRVIKKFKSILLQLTI